MISRRVTKLLVKNSIIEERDYDLYLYSIQSLLGNVINIITCLILGILFGEVIKAVIFLVIMIPLRSSVGGYHLKNSVTCYIASTFLVAICLVLPRYLPIGFESLYFIMTSIFIGCITIIAPVDCITKPMLIEEKNKMHRRVRWLVILIEVGYVVVLVLGANSVCKEIFLISLYTFLVLVAEIIRKSKRD